MGDSLGAKVPHYDAVPSAAHSEMLTPSVPLMARGSRITRGSVRIVQHQRLISKSEMHFLIVTQCSLIVGKFLTRGGSMLFDLFGLGVLFPQKRKSLELNPSTHAVGVG